MDLVSRSGKFSKKFEGFTGKIHASRRKKYIGGLSEFDSLSSKRAGVLVHFIYQAFILSFMLSNLREMTCGSYYQV